MNSTITSQFSTPLLFQLAMVLLWSFFNNYNKSYAMLYIADDKFLAVAAVIQNVMNGSCRLFFGFMFDRLGFKVVTIKTYRSFTV